MMVRNVTKRGIPTLRIGIFRRMADADRAAQKLLIAGFRRQDLSIICKDAPPPGSGEPGKPGNPKGAKGRKKEGSTDPPAGSVSQVRGGGLLRDLLGLGAEVSGALFGALTPLLGPGGLEVRVRIASNHLDSLKEEEAERCDQAVGEGKIVVVAECRNPRK